MPFINIPQNKYVDDSYFDMSKTYFREVSGYQTIKESIENIILTYPGEILFEPSFGCGLIYKLFSNFSETNVDIMKEIIVQSIQNWEPRVILLRENININMDVDNHALYLELSYLVKSSGKQDTYKKLIGV
jgi:phage baseplate assembly protein W